MKKPFFLLLLAANLFLTGCFGYNDINRIIFTTALVVDYEEEEFIVYLEAFHSFRSNKTNSETGERVVYAGRGITINDAARRINQKSSYKIDYTQNKVLIITERAAKEGITDFLDLYERFQETLLRSHIVVLDGEPEELLQMEIEEDEYIGLYLYELLENPVMGVANMHDRINQFYNYRLMGERVAVVSILTLEKDLYEDKIKIQDSAVFQNDKMVYKLKPEERMAYHFLINQMKRNLVVFSNPVKEEGEVVIDLLSSKTSTDISYDGKTIQLEKKITINSIVAGIEEPMTLDLAALRKFEEASANVIEQNCHKLFNKYKELNIDLFDVKENFNRKYPNEEVEDPLQITSLVVKVNNHLQGSTNKTGFVK